MTSCDNHESIKQDTLKMLRRIYRMVDNDECASVESLNAGLTAMYGNQMLNKTASASYLGIAVSTFDKYVAEGIIPKGVKKQNECIKWRVSILDQVAQNLNK